MDEPVTSITMGEIPCFLTFSDHHWVSDLRDWRGETRCTVGLSEPGLATTLEIPVLVCNNEGEALCELFDRMDAEWRGWPEPLVWTDIERSVRLSFTNDRLSHVRVDVEFEHCACALTPRRPWRASGAVTFSISDLPTLAKAFRSFFDPANAGPEHESP